MSTGREAKARIARTVRLPDPIKTLLYSRAPDLGPKVLFFSGGTALRETSRELLRFTYNSIHLISPFDSGGSSAVLREAFGLLAVGDLRNRLMALADRSLHGHPEVFGLFAFRFPENGDAEVLVRWLEAMVHGEDELVAAIPDPIRELVRSHLRYFLEAMPQGFDLRGANIGNLILVGGYLNNNRHIDAVVFLFSKLVNVRGKVRPTTSSNLHLAAELEDGRTLVGQHLLTGKEVPPLTSPIRRLWLTEGRGGNEVVSVGLRDKVRRLIEEADVICFPMGSFYTSVVANLLVSGVGQAVADSQAPKIYVPNTTADPEVIGMTLSSSVSTLLGYLEQSCSRKVSNTHLLQHVLVDTQATVIPPKELRAIEDLGVQVIDAGLVTRRSAPYIDAELLARCLVSFA